MVLATAGGVNPSSTFFPSVDPAPRAVAARAQAAFRARQPDACVRDFETAWDEARWLRDVMSGWTDTRKHKKNPTPDDEVFIDRAMRRRELIHQRLTDGFIHFGGDVGGRHRPAFRESGLRSDDSHVLRRIVHATPRTSRLQSGRTKDVMRSTDAKILALDEPWIVLNAEVRSVFRIDLDHVFPSWNALRHEMERLPLPCPPHVVVGFEDEAGRIERPHVIFLLPYNAGVWFSEKARQDIMRLWRGVHAGITKALLPLGADPGALTNPMRIKNPVSPFWTYRTWNETTFPSLSDWSGWVDTGTDRTRMIRESAAALSGTDRKISNIMFTTFQEWAYETLREFDRAADPAYVRAVMVKDSDGLAEMLFRALVGRASKMSENPKQGMAILYRVTTYAADHWDPSRAARDKARDRGACADDVEGVSGVAARQAIGARYTASARRSKSAAVIREAITQAEAAGETITKALIARRTGLSRPTVQAGWPAKEV